MPKPSQYTNATWNDPQLTAALTTLLSKHLSLTVTQTRLTATDIWAVLSYAAVQRTSLDAAARELPNAPSGNRLREVVMAGLPALPVLQGQLNRILRRQLPRRVTRGKTAYELAIDLTLIPYHGQPAVSEAELLRQAPKNGTTHFHGYATVALVHQQQRYVVAFCFVEAGTKMAVLVRTLLTRVQNLGIRTKLVLLDKGFYAGAVFRTLARRGLSYIVPARLGQTHRLFQRRGSYRTTHRLAHAQGGAYLVALVVVKRFQRGKKGKRKAVWLGYCVGGWPRHLSFAQVRARYRQRFGIETSFRQMNQVRARTSTRSPVLRLLYFGLALILVNWYLSWRVPRPHGPTPAVPVKQRTLRQLAVACRRAIEHWFRIRVSATRQTNPSLS
jgi:Transposase DDE domain